MKKMILDTSFIKKHKETGVFWLSPSTEKIGFPIEKEGDGQILSPSFAVWGFVWGSTILWSSCWSEARWPKVARCLY